MIHKKTQSQLPTERVKSYHLKQNQKTWSYTEEDGTMLGQKITPLDRVGLYVPGGKASLSFFCIDECHTSKGCWC